MQLAELAARVSGTLQPSSSANQEIDRVGSPASADPRALLFAETEAALVRATASAAGAVLTTSALAAKTDRAKPLLLTDQPRLAFARAARLFAAEEPTTGIHPTAAISPAARLDADVSIGAGAVVEENAAIGRRTRIGAGAVIGAGVVIGAECRIYPRVVIYPGTTLGDKVVVHAGAVLGADGFGYVFDAVTGEYTQFPQQGRLVVEDDVEIGANATVDRGALEETRIASGTKLDNLVHVGHNVSIGRNVVIAAQTGVSGSSTIGDGAIVGGQVGIADHVEIGAGAILGAQAGIPSRKRIHGPGVVFWGTPARPIQQYLKDLATLARLTRNRR